MRYEQPPGGLLSYLSDRLPRGEEVLQSTRTQTFVCKINLLGKIKSTAVLLCALYTVT